MSVAYYRAIFFRGGEVNFFSNFSWREIMVFKVVAKSGSFGRSEGVHRTPGYGPA